eukprot:5436127-Alexandrium_andersonii.AAC.1
MPDAESGHLHGGADTPQEDSDPRVAGALPPVARRRAIGAWRCRNPDSGPRGPAKTPPARRVSRVRDLVRYCPTKACRAGILRSLNAGCARGAPPCWTRGLRGSAPCVHFVTGRGLSSLEAGHRRRAPAR